MELVHPINFGLFERIIRLAFVLASEGGRESLLIFGVLCVVVYYETMANSFHSDFLPHRHPLTLSLFLSYYINHPKSGLAVR
jgi:hypothetical protein